MKFDYIELRGFRSYGGCEQRIELANDLTVVHGANSQGKTSLAEAIEFLLTGKTSRRVLLGGSPSEYEKSLVNTHIGAAGAVYVEAGISTGPRKFTLRRELVSDYAGAGECASVLKLDDRVVDSVSAVGIELADPPVEAPVLLQHSLRYALAAKPGDRSEYFKALLEVADLDIVRSSIKQLRSRVESAPEPAVLKRLSLLLQEPAFGTVLARILETRDITEIEQYFVIAGRIILERSSRDSSQIPSENVIPAVREALEGLQESLLPVSSLTADALPDLDVDAHVTGAKEATEEFGSQISTVDQRVADVLPLLQVAIGLPHLSTVGIPEPVDCPLCLARQSLTPDRIAEIRAQVANHEGVSSKAATASSELSYLRQSAIRIRDDVTKATPRCHYWSHEQREHWTIVADQLGAPDGWLEATLRSADDIADKAASVAELASFIVNGVDQLSAAVANLDQPPQERISGIASTAARLSGTYVQLQTLLDSYRTLTGGVIDALRQAIEEQTNTRSWQSLVQLAQTAREVCEALHARDRNAAKIKRLRLAERDIDRAIRAVLDKRLADMGNEIRRWWQSLRPNEPVSFGNVTRKGSGKKYLDMTAVLSSQMSGDVAERNAISVLSDSQLNALGLSAFLARCTLHKSPLIVLDDPIPGTDPEHRSTFTINTIKELLNSEHQILITTFSVDLVRDLKTLYQHRMFSEYQLTLEDVFLGTQLVRAGDDFREMMLAAANQMHSPLRENRRAAGNSMRIAAERLAKLVIIANRRAEGLESNLGDFVNKNLKDLRPIVARYCLRPEEPGLWQFITRVLNDANHDTPEPPSSQDLKTCHGQLESIRREHARKHSNLMSP